MNFTAFRERTKDLTGPERKAVFDMLPSTLQDAAWATHAEWVTERSAVEEWIASDSPYGYKEWRECRQ